MKVEVTRVESLWNLVIDAGGCQALLMLQWNTRWPRKLWHFHEEGSTNRLLLRGPSFLHSAGRYDNISMHDPPPGVSTRCSDQIFKYQRFASAPLFWDPVARRVLFCFQVSRNECHEPWQALIMVLQLVLLPRRWVPYCSFTLYEISIACFSIFETPARQPSYLMSNVGLRQADG